MVKPFVKDELLARIETLLEARKARQATTENAQLHQEMQRRIQVEDALRLSQSRMAALLDTLNVGLWCVADDGRISYANKFATQWIGREIVDDQITTYLSSEEFEALRAACQADGHADRREIRCSKWALFQCSPMSWSRKQVVA